MQEDLDDFTRKFPDRFKVYYVLSKVGLHTYTYTYIHTYSPHNYIIIIIIFLALIVIILFQYFWQAPEAWTGGGGRVSKEMIQNHCPPPAPDIRVIFLIFFNYLYLYIYLFIARCCFLDENNFLIVLQLSNIFQITDNEVRPTRHEQGRGSSS